MKTYLLLVFALLQTALLAAGGPTFRLVTPSEILAPGETVGVKFSSRMSEELSDKPAIVVEPNIPYEFAWTSPSTASIRFLSVLDLDMQLRFEPRPGLKDLAGRLVESPPAPERTRTTPRFGVLQARVNGLSGPWGGTAEQNLAANASVRITLNDDAQPDALRQAARFVSDDGVTIAAGSVTRAQRYSFQERLLTWKERASKDPAPAVLALADGQNDWVVAPGQSLAEGKTWHFELDLNALRRRASAPPEPMQRIPMGRVVPLTVLSTRFTKRPLESAELVLSCSKAVLGEERKRLLQATALLTPPVPELNVAINATEVRLTGNFQPGVPYQVRLERGLRASDGTSLNHPYEGRVQLDPLPPRLYFDDGLVRQLSSGGRRIALMGVKIPEARLTAHLIPPDKGWRALELWKQYQSEFEEADQGAKRAGIRVEPADFEGRLVYDKAVPFSYSNAQECQVFLNWDDILGKDRTGLVLLTAEEHSPSDKAPPTGRPRRGVQTLVQLTDIGLELFSGRGGPGFCFAYSLRDTTPLEGVKCRFYDAKRGQVGEVETGKDGTVSIPFQGASWIEATRGEDQVTVYFDADSWFASQADNAPQQPDARKTAPPELHGFIFSDRDLYRPGETLHAKALVRKARAGGLEIPTDLQFHVLLSGDRGERLHEEDITLNSAGAWTFSKNLPTRTGGYTLTLTQADSNFSINRSVDVAEFQPDAFHINLVAPTTLQAPGIFEARVSASYLSGQPVNDGIVRWELHDTPAVFADSAYGAMVFGVRLQPNVMEALWKSAPIDVHSGEIKLDGAGAVAFTRQIDANPNPPGPRDMVFQTEITDLNNQTLSKSHSFVAHSSDFYLGIHLPRRWFHAGVSVPVQLVAVNPETHLPLEPEAPVELSLHKVLWSSSVTRTAAGEVRNRSARFEAVQKMRVRPQLPAHVSGQWILERGKVAAELQNLPAGEYVLEARTTDSRGRTVLSTLDFDVAQKGTPQDSLADLERDALSVAPDKSLYHPGETAHILVRSNTDGLALATFQQESVQRHWLVPITKERPYFEFPIQPADAPGGVLEVHLLRGTTHSKLKNPMPAVDADDVMLRVEPSDARLQVSLSGLPADARPGTLLKPVVHVLQADGQPAVGADVTLYAVHEGVLKMTGYLTPDPVDGVYPMSFRRLRWRSNIWALRHEGREPDYENKGYVVGSDGKGGSGSDLRGNFKLNALWIGSASTGPDGAFSASLEVPDNLAKFRVMAVVTHGPQSFGSAEASFRVNKPLQVQSGIPLFANVGDRLNLRCLVQNSLEHPLEVSVSLETDASVRLEGQPVQSVSIPSKTSVALDFPATFTAVGKAELQWRARTVDGSESDGMKDAIEVGWPVPAAREHLVQRVETGGLKPFDAVQPALLSGVGEATVTLHRSPLAVFQEAATGLLTYPYGCAEQTVSKLFPWVLAADLHLPGVDLQKRAETIERGLTRIFSMQMPDGSIGYWPPTESHARAAAGHGATGHPWCSAYAAVLVALVEKDSDPGISNLVSPELAGKLRAYLKTWLTKPATAELAASYPGQTLAAYALALSGNPETGSQERLLDSIHLLGTDDRALLAMAIHLSGGLEKNVRRLLKDSAREPGLDYFSSPTRDAAIALLAAVQTGAAADEIDKLFAASHPRDAQASARGTTQERAWALYAASAYARSLPPQQAQARAAWIRGDKREEILLNELHPFEATALSWKSANRGPDLLIENLSSGPLYAVTSVTAHPDREQPPQQSGYILHRRFEKIDPNGVATPATDLRVGDRVRVTLELSALQNGRYLAVDCPLPALLEPFQTFHKEGSADEEEGGADIDHSEIRADRVFFFKDAVHAGTYRFTQMTRVRAAGEAVAPAARAEEMYRSERFAQTASQRLSAR